MDNCGTTYFSSQFRGVNAKGFGDYADGFVPTPTPVATREYEVNGCRVADDYSNPLGNVNEARFSAALGYISTGSCPAASATIASRVLKSPTLQRSGPALTQSNKMPGMVRR